jgi:pilus assembly protein CpaB
MALVLALAVSGTTTWLVSKRMLPPDPQRSPDAWYVAAARPLEVGETLKPDNVELAPWPRSHPLNGAFLRVSDVLGREILFPLDKGEPILVRDLPLSGAGTGLASKIPDGMRAVALRSDEVVGVAGFLMPGSHLDVLVTYRSDKSPDPLTATVLQNVIVMAAGHQVQPDPQGKPSDVTVVTLLLNPQQSQRAVLASSQGAIHFVLRNAVDTSTNQNAQLFLSDLTAPDDPLAKPKMVRMPVVPHPPQRQEHEIETVLGGADRKPSSSVSVGGVQ